MKRMISRFGIFCALLMSTTGLALAQSDADAAKGCAVLGTCGIFILALVVINIAILVWVARDAKARGMDGAILWMLLVFFLGLLGLVIYLLVRPAGNLLPCPNCRNKRLQASQRCPHCGFGM